MTITKANILTQVQNRTGRGSSVTDIDVELLAIMKEVSVRVIGAMETTGTVTVAASGTSIAQPSDTIKIDAVTDPDGKILEKMPIKTLLALHEADLDNAAIITNYAEYKKHIYVQPTPTALLK